MINLLLRKGYFSFLFFLTNTLVPISKWRALTLNLLHPGFFFSKNVLFRKNITFYGGGDLKGKLSIGANSFINTECFIDYSSNIQIGKNVKIGMRCMILSSSHKISTPIRCGHLTKKITVIKDNCWLAAGVIVLPGVTINEGCIISAGEIVSFNIPENMLYKNNELIPIDVSENIEKGRVG